MYTKKEFNKRKYLNYADKISYIPNINKFNTGSLMQIDLSTVGDIKPLTYELPDIGTPFTIGKIKDLEDIEINNLPILHIKLEENKPSFWLANKGELLGSLASTFAANMVMPSTYAYGGIARMKLNLNDTPYAVNIGGNYFSRGNGIHTNAGNLHWIGAAIGAANTMTNALANGKTIGGTAGKMVGSIPVVGGVLNAIFGKKKDALVEALVNLSINSLNQTALSAANANNFDDSSLTASIAANTNTKVWSGHGVKKLNNLINLSIKDALLFALNALLNAINNIVLNLIDLQLANYAALGGPIDKIDTSSPIGYYFMNEWLNNKLKEINKDKMSLPTNLFDQYAKGGYLKKGEELDLTSEEIKNLIAQGYEIEYV